MYGRIHTLDNDVGSDARQWLATLRPGLQHISATGLSSDPYGYAAGENLPLNSTAVPDDTRPWPSNTSLRALQVLSGISHNAITSRAARSLQPSTACSNCAVISCFPVDFSV